MNRTINHRVAVQAILTDGFYMKFSEEGFSLTNSLEHRTLCSVFATTRYARRWDKFWLKFNRSNYGYAHSYFDQANPDLELRILWRLLIVEQFIDWLEYYY